MHLTNCLHPIKIHRHGEDKYLPCGKCDYCRYIRALASTQRITLELQHYKYRVFGTLTYADMFLPRMVYDSKNRGFVCTDCNGVDCSVDEDCGLFVSYPFPQSRSLDYIEHRMNNFGFIPRLRKSDCQKFFKRLRINLKRQLKYSKDEQEEYQTFYACCGEYGPTTFRPHYHFIFAFNSKRIADIVFKTIHSSWPFGSSKTRWLGDRESSGYITKYINGFFNLLTLFKVREIRPFLLVSKSHPLGFYSVSKEEIQNVVRFRTPTINIRDLRKGTPANVPLWPALENRLFPRFSGFGCVDNRLRIRLLRLALSTPCLKEFFEVFRQSSSFNAFNEYFEDIKVFRYDSRVGQYLFTYCKDIGKNFSYKKFESNCIKSIYYFAVNIRRNMHQFCIDTPEEYLDIIDEYYKNKELFKLEQQFILEDEVMRNAPDLINCIDLEFFTDKVLDSFDMRCILDRMCNEKEHSHKNKKKNEYLALHPEYRYSEREDFLEGFVNV